MTEAKAREWVDYWTARFGSEEAISRLQCIIDEGPNAKGLNERMLSKDPGSTPEHSEAA